MGAGVGDRRLELPDERDNSFTVSLARLFVSILIIQMQLVLARALISEIDSDPRGAQSASTTPPPVNRKSARIVERRKQPVKNKGGATRRALCAQRTYRLLFRNYQRRIDFATHFKGFFLAAEFAPFCARTRLAILRPASHAHIFARGVGAARSKGQKWRAPLNHRHAARAKDTAR
jgi:hypothetical protein